MVNNASRFTQNRTDVIALTNLRIKKILWYVIECHQIFIDDKKTYSLKGIKSQSKIKAEEYFRTKFFRFLIFFSVKDCYIFMLMSM